MMGSTSSASDVTDLRAVLALAERLSQLDAKTLDADLAALAEQHDALFAERQRLESLQRAGAAQVSCLEEATHDHRQAAEAADAARLQANASLCALSAQREQLDRAQHQLAADQATLAGVQRAMASEASNNAAALASARQALLREQLELKAERAELATQLAAAQDAQREYEAKMVALRAAVGA